MCPACLSRGVTNILGEVLPDGTFAVQRLSRKKPGSKLTIISGNEFKVGCAECGSLILIHKEADEGVCHRLDRVRRVEFSQYSFRARLGSQVLPQG